MMLRYFDDSDFLNQEMQENINRIETPQERRNLLVFSLSYFLGLSNSQISNLLIEDINFEKRIIKSYSPKLHKFIEYKLNENTWKILYLYLSKDNKRKSGLLILASYKSGFLIEKGITCRAVHQNISGILKLSKNYKIPEKKIRKTIDLEKREINFLINLLIHSARKRKLDLLLTNEQIEKLVFSKCHYCGKLPSNILRYPHSEKVIEWNGIDRIDSSKGYVIENVVSCCGICNKMKMAMSYEEFIDHIKLINIHIRSIPAAA